MRRSDPSPLEPEAQTALAVIDATLAGEAVAPEHAELAELALILAGQRPTPSPAFAAELDRRVAGRFAAPKRPARAGRGRGRRWLYAPGAMAAVAAVVAIVVGLSSLPPGSSSSSQSSAAGSAGVAESSSSSAAGGPARRTALPQQDLAPNGAKSPAKPTVHSPAGSSSESSAASASGSSAASAPPSGAALPVPSAPGGNRKVIQTAQISLSTRPDRVDSVAQEVFDVVHAQDGVVENSTVTADGSANGYAQFQLSVPSANLQQTMASLSGLHGAAVVSRTDTSQDVTGDVGGAGRRLADARALRTSLLRRLAAATTTTEIDSLKAQIRDAEASIASNLSTLNSLKRRVDNTQVSVTINAAMLPGRVTSGSTGFTIRRAAHDAGRVLVVAAGIALIALAVLLPLSLVVAIMLWLAQIVRRRRREAALDLL